MGELAQKQGFYVVAGLFRQSLDKETHQFGRFRDRQRDLGG